MAGKLAVKRLTNSDLTFFHWHFRNRNAGNQKAINLNADVLVDLLYPDLPTAMAKTKWRTLLDLSIFGPGLQGELNLPRKIVKGDTYKNYRLDGEVVPNPDDSPERFNILDEGDIVVFEFAGEESPTELRAVFVARRLAEDVSLHNELDGFLGERSMASLGHPDLDALVARAAVAADHPIRELLLAERTLEDIAQGGTRLVERLRRHPTRPKISRAALDRAIEAAEEIGQLGEQFIDEWLRGKVENGEIGEYQWVSREDAISPYDFEARTPEPTFIRVDGKSTAGGFERDFHLSIGQLHTMVEEDKEFWLCRVYEIKGKQAKMRVKIGMREFARSVLAALQYLPTGVELDSVSVDPSTLDFLPEIEVHLREEPVEEKGEPTRPETAALQLEMPPYRAN